MKIMAFHSIGWIFGKNVWTILGHKNSKPSQTVEQKWPKILKVGIS